MNARKFTVKPGPHAPQLAIQAHDLSLAECKSIESVVCNQYTDSDDYKMKRGAEPFLQGSTYPLPGQSDGWILVEFWSHDRAAIDAWVRHLEKRLPELTKFFDDEAVDY